MADETRRSQAASQATEVLDEREPAGKPALSTADLASTSREPARREEAQPAAHDPAGAAGEEREALLPGQDIQDFRGRWESIQAGFVDSPRQAVEQADGLVAEVMKRLAEVFANERADLEAQWSRGEDVSTEDLRQALRRYRSFFGRLLSV